MCPGDGAWVVPLRKAVESPGIRLICFPYAGGSPDVFRAWSDDVSPGVELLAVRLPGRGRRLAEPPYGDWASLLADSYAALSPYLASPHAFYGHSFGGRLAYELARMAGRDHPGQTRRLFVGGCRSPDRPQRQPYLHQLPEQDFVEALRAMGGTPSEVLDDARLIRFFLPTVRAEIRLAELWDDRHGRPSGIPITAIYGREDPIDDAPSTQGWAAFGGPGSEVIGLPGGHFFLETNRRRLLDVVNSRLGEPTWSRRDQAGY